MPRPLRSRGAAARVRLRGRDGIIGATIAANLTLAGVWVVLFVALLVTERTRGADFTAFYTGWRLVIEGQGTSLYDPAAQAAMQRVVLEGQSFEAGLNPFNNPPHMVLPFVPLGLLPLEISFLVWTAFQLLLLASVLLMLVRGPAREWSRLERAALISWFLGFPALGITFWQGAFSLVLVTGVVGTYLALSKRHDGLGGLALVAASIKPQGMAGVGPAILVGRRWRALIAAAAGGAALGTAATLAFGAGIWTSYLGFLRDYTSTFDRYSVDPSVMWNLRGTLALILGREQAGLVNALAFGGFAVGMVAISVLWRRGWSPTAPESDTAARFGLTIAITLLLSPHINPHDDLLMVVAAVLAYAAWRDSPRSHLALLAIGVVPVLITFMNGVDAAASSSLPIRVPTVALVGLIVALVAALRRPRLRGAAVRDLAS